MKVMYAAFAAVDMDAAVAAVVMDAVAVAAVAAYGQQPSQDAT